MLRKKYLWITGALVLGLGVGESAWACNRCGNRGGAMSMSAASAPMTMACASPAVAMVPQQQTSYQTVMETVYEQVPVTQMQVRPRTEYRTEQYPVPRLV